MRTLQILYVQYESQRNKILYFFCLKQYEMYILRQQNKCVKLKPEKKIELDFNFDISSIRRPTGGVN